MLNSFHAKEYKNRKFIENLVLIHSFFVVFYPQIKFYKKPYKKSSFFLSEDVGMTLIDLTFFYKKLIEIVLYSIKIEEKSLSALYFFISTP